MYKINILDFEVINKSRVVKIEAQEFQINIYFDNLLQINIFSKITFEIGDKLISSMQPYDLSLNSVLSNLTSEIVINIYEEEGYLCIQFEDPSKILKIQNDPMYESVILLDSSNDVQALI
jgi:hypothetical protein